MITFQVAIKSIMDAADRQDISGLVCGRCRDSAKLVVAMLQIEEITYDWPLCGECLRQLPMAASNG